MTLETTRRCFRVDRCQISFIKFILEAYDNVAVMSTLDSQLAVVRIAIAPGCETMVDGIIDSFTGEFDMVPVDHETGACVVHDKDRLPAGRHG